MCTTAQGPYLAMAQSAMVSGDVLVLLDEDGEVIDELPRARRR